MNYVTTLVIRCYFQALVLHVTGVKHAWDLYVASKLKDKQKLLLQKCLLSPIASSQSNLSFAISIISYSLLPSAGVVATLTLIIGILSETLACGVRICPEDITFFSFPK